ncbi:MAG: copper amine oxidase N-terminal domain-containing protein [Peptostreptococcaceae bacterium]|nr:copper amine oxidase N-terminal domain-containing protein [Peptostreptococcaceae bacterium]
MKKRLSLLLAALMIITLLPMSSFAVSTPKVNVQTVTNEDKGSNKAVPVRASFEFTKSATTANMAAQNLVFTLNAGSFSTGTYDHDDNTTTVEIAVPAPAVQWNGAALGTAVVNVESGVMTVKVPAAQALAGANGDITALTVDFYVDITQASAGDLTFSVLDSNETLAVGEDTVGTKENIKLLVIKDADTSELAMTAKDSEKAVSFDGGDLSQFEIRNFKKMATPMAAPTTEFDAPDRNQLVISFEDDYVKFDAGTKVIVDGGTIAGAVQADGRIVLTSAQVPATTKYVLVIPKVTGMNRKASEGSVRVNAAIIQDRAAAPGAGLKKPNPITLASNSVVVGKIVDYSVTMTVVERGKKEIPSVWGGEEAKVKVTLKGPKGSFLNRVVEFKAEGADVKYISGSGFTGEKDGEVFKDGEFEYKPATPADLSQATEFSFFIEIITAANKDGVATLTAAQRGWETKADLAKVTPKFSIKADAMPVKKGEARATADVMITEAKAGLLTKSDKIQLKFSTRRDYTQFSTKAIKVEATNGMKFGDVDYGNSGKDFTVLEIPITKQSHGEPAVITISGIKVLVDGSSTDDTIKINGQLNKATVANTEYIKVVKEYALESILTVFTIGQTQYTVNGDAKTAASAPYIKNGKTMLPIRALSESLGLTVQWNGQTKTATFTDSTKVAAVTIGAEKMFVNGTPIPLAAKAELVNGTTFVELRSLATAFGVQIDWDAAAKTATVSK